MSGSSTRDSGRDHLGRICRAVGNRVQWLQGYDSHGSYWQNPKESLFLGLASDLPPWKASTQFWWRFCRVSQQQPEVGCARGFLVSQWLDFATSFLRGLSSVISCLIIIHNDWKESSLAWSMAFIYTSSSSDERVCRAGSSFRNSQHVTFERAS